MRRNEDVAFAVVLVRRLAAEALQDAERDRERDVDARERLHAIGAEANAALRGLRSDDMHVTARRDGAGCELEGELDRTAQHLLDIARVDAALEAMARFGVHAVATCRPAHRARIEPRALVEHALRVVLDLAVGAAHDAGERDGTVAVADEEIVGDELAVDAVERLHRLAFLGEPHVDLGAAHAREIERMHRVAVLEHHEIRHIDDVRDRTDAERLKAVLHPQRRRCDRDADDARGAVMRAALLVRDRDRDERCGRARVEALRRRDHRPGERDVEDRRQLAHEADVPEAVGPVRRQADLEDGVPRVRHGRRERRARRGDPCRKNHDSVGLFAEPELRLAAEHALGRDAGDRARRDREVLRGQVDAERREDDEAARLGHVRCAADDFLGFSGVALDGDEAEPALSWGAA